MCCNHDPALEDHVCMANFKKKIDSQPQPVVTCLCVWCPICSALLSCSFTNVSHPFLSVLCLVFEAIPTTHNHHHHQLRCVCMLPVCFVCLSHTWAQASSAQCQNSCVQRLACGFQC